jgi:hypothetical protein
MKKMMLVISIVSALVFLVSVTAVAPSFAAQTTKAPTTKQAGPAQTTVPQQMPKQKFWDLEVGSITVKGQVIKIGGGNHTINVKVGETVTFKCLYRAKTPLIGDITPADAQYWGNGNHPYDIRLQVYFPTPNLDPDTLFKNKSLPKFTYEDVKNWHLRPGVGKAWDEEVVFQWTPKPQYVGIPYISIVFNLDINHVIPEPDENNGYINSAGGLLTIVVSQ